MHVNVRAEQSLLEFARMIERINDGIKLPNEIMNNGRLTSEAAAIIRHILYSHPNIGWAAFLRLFNEFFVLLNGRAADEREFPSMATIRNQIHRLDIFDQHEVR